MPRLLAACLLACLTTTLFAAERHEPRDWGIAFGLRSAQIPYLGTGERVYDAIPLFYYDDDKFLFLDGLEGGLRLWRAERWNLEALARYRFFDIPAEQQNRIRGNALDVGARIRYRLAPDWHLDAELLNDQETRYHANLGLGYRWRNAWLDLRPWARLRYKDASFNDHYYGLDRTAAGAAFDLQFGAEARLHLVSNFYLLGRLDFTVLDGKTAGFETIESPVQRNYYLGVAFFKRHDSDTRRRLASTPYLRLSHGWATPSSLGEIITFSDEPDPYNNRMTSLFYGHPIADRLFGAPISVYLTAGAVWHHASSVQANIGEYVMAIKGYWHFDHAVRWRLGVAEGLSYTPNITYIEQQEMDKNDYRGSKLMDYLDFTADLNLGDLFDRPDWGHWWAGVGIHHRSGIYESSSAFGRIKGGSNYKTLYLQYHW